MSAYQLTYNLEITMLKSTSEGSCEAFNAGFSEAIEQMKESIENANSNSSGDTAPWSWNYEFTDHLLQLEADHYGIQR